MTTKNAPLTPADEGRRSSEELGLVERLRLRTLVQHGGPKGMDYGWNLQEHDSELHRDAANEIDRLRDLMLDYAIACGELSKGLSEDDPMWNELKELGDRMGIA